MRFWLFLDWIQTLFRIQALGLQEHEEDCQDKAHEGGDVVPVKGLALEHEHDNHGEHREGDNFLNNF